MPTVKIISRYDSTKVLFECEVTKEQQDSGTALRHALEKATAAHADLGSADLGSANLGSADLRGANLRGANLRGADLRGANLRGADLYGADLRGANLRGADLRGANLRSANLRGADLRRANLYGANLGSADLYGADLRGADLGSRKLIGSRPFLQIGPIGSRCDYLQAFITDGALMIRAGCFFDTRDQFAFAVQATHGDNEHAQEYMAALALIDAHARLWTPKAEEVTEVQATGAA